MKPLRNALPPLNALAVFEAAARSRNLAEAARELCISASAVSRHVANLEEHTGLELFVRRGHELRVTPTGRELARVLTESLTTVRNTIELLRAKSLTRIFTIGASHDNAATWLLPRLDDLRARFPGTEIRIVTADNYVALEEYDVQVSIRYGNGEWEGLVAERLFDEEVFPICAPVLLRERPELAGGPPMALVQAPLLHLADRVQGLTWSDWFLAEQINAPVVRGPIFSSYTLLLLEVLTGHGVGLGYAHVVDGLVSERHLVRLTKHSLRSRNGIYAAFRDNKSDQVKEIVAWLKDSVDRFRGGGAVHKLRL